MSERRLRETDLFKGLNVFLLERNSEQLESIKKKISMIENVQMDNSALFRGMLEYFHENPDRLIEVAPYTNRMKGYRLLEEFQEMIRSDRTLKDIEKELGISVELSAKAKKRLTTETKKSKKE